MFLLYLFIVRSVYSTFLSKLGVKVKPDSEQRNCIDITVIPL